MGLFIDLAAENISFLGKRVLIVDDEECIVSLFQSILKSVFSDIKIDSAKNGLQAVESFQSNQHELLLMDLHMPIMDGFSAYNEINQLCDSENWEMPPALSIARREAPRRCPQVHSFMDTIEKRTPSTMSSRTLEDSSK